MSAPAKRAVGRPSYDWMKRGEQPGPANKPHREFRAVILKAQAECESTLVTRIAKAAQNGSWGAAAWLLERRAPERWVKPSRSSSSNGEEPEAPQSGFDELDNVTPLRRPARQRRSA